MSDPPFSDAESSRFVLHFLTDQWEWEEGAPAETLEQAKLGARDALTAVVRDESPEVACVTLTDHGVKVGVWDWVGDQPYWTGV